MLTINTKKADKIVDVDAKPIKPIDKGTQIPISEESNQTQAVKQGGGQAHTQAKVITQVPNEMIQEIKRTSLSKVFLTNLETSETVYQDMRMVLDGSKIDIDPAMDNI